MYCYCYTLHGYIYFFFFVCFCLLACLLVFVFSMCDILCFVRSCNLLFNLSDRILTLTLTRDVFRVNNHHIQHHILALEKHGNYVCCACVFVFIYVCAIYLSLSLSLGCLLFCCVLFYLYFTVAIFGNSIFTISALSIIFIMLFFCFLLLLTVTFTYSFSSFFYCFLLLLLLLNKFCSFVFNAISKMNAYQHINAF